MISATFYGLAASVMLAAPGSRYGEPGNGIQLPLDISTEGWRIDSMLHFALISTGLLFLVMVTWMIIAMVFHRDGKRKAAYTHGTSRRAAIGGLAIGFAIFFCIDGVLFYNSTVDVTEVLWNYELANVPGAVRIEINARQWAWQARYAGPDGRFATPDDVVTLNDVRVPVDTPIAIQLTASDVIHSLYLPNLRIKTDAIPGTVNRVWFQVDKERLARAKSNQFEIACAQHCGTHHYKMRGRLTVYSKSEFDAWLAEAAVNAALDYDAGPVAQNEEEPADQRYLAHWGWKWREI